MHTINVRNVNDAYAEAMYIMAMIGVPKPSRVGGTLSAVGPVMTVYSHPTERMLFDFRRDANPFFHIFEGIWMLAGRNDVKWLSQFNSRMADFSDDGHTFHGTYGFRWREHFGVDQIKAAVRELKRNPATRRVVLAMWDPIADLGKVATGRDVPCNTTIYLMVRQGALDMTVCCRSNDIVWGCYGANAVHMSMLQEFVAQAADIPVGKYYQFSNDWHVYEHHWPLIGKLPPEKLGYPQGHIDLTNPMAWEYDLDEELPNFIENPYAPTGSYYVEAVLQPMMNAWQFYKRKEKDKAFNQTLLIRDEAVRRACYEWLVRRRWTTEEA